MKKEWNNPSIKNAALKETKNNPCPYETSLLQEGQLTAEECCNCEFYTLCNKSKKYIGVCNS